MLLAITISGNALVGILAPAIALALVQVGLLIHVLSTGRANAANTKSQVDRLENLLQAHLVESALAVTNLARLEVTVDANAKKTDVFHTDIKRQLKENGDSTNHWRATAESRLEMLEQHRRGTSRPT